ncbi:hypothetical protein YC2023_020102 [Brassica napus]
MGTASFFTIIVMSAPSRPIFRTMVFMHMYLQVATVLVSLFIGFVVGFITVAISSLVLLWLYGSFWTTLLFLFSGRKLLPVSSVLSL